MGLITVKNNTGLEMVLCTHAAAIYDIRFPDKNGHVESIVVTAKDVEKYSTVGASFGKTIGRTGGRLTGGRFTLEGKEYKVPSWDPNGLHGGDYGFTVQEFDYVESETDDSYVVDFSYTSPDGESNYPGNVVVHVIYTIYKNKNVFEINFKAKTDKTTLMNLANHAYFNLAGDMKRLVLDEELYMNSTNMVMVKNALPSYIFKETEKYSFKTPHKIGDYVDDPELINNVNGIDFPYLFDEVGLEYKNLVMTDYVSGRRLNIYSTYPAVVIYTYNYPEDLVSPSGVKHQKYHGLAIECMYCPNTVNLDCFPEKLDVLTPDREYDEKVVYELEIL